MNRKVSRAVNMSECTNEGADETRVARPAVLAVYKAGGKPLR